MMRSASLINLLSDLLALPSSHLTSNHKPQLQPRRLQISLSIPRRSVSLYTSAITLLGGLALAGCHDEEVGGVQLKAGEIRVANYQLASFTYKPRSGAAQAPQATQAPTVSQASQVSQAPQAPQAPQANKPQTAQGVDRAVASSGLRSMTVAAIGKRAMREVDSGAQGETPSQPGTVTGEIRLAPELKVGFPSGATLYIVARAGASARGMPVAVKRIKRVSVESFPLSYTLTQADSMAGAPLSGAVTISVSVDQDGNAFSKEPGDLKGSLKSPAQVGANPVHVTLDQRL